MPRLEYIDGNDSRRYQEKIFRRRRIVKARQKSKRAKYSHRYDRNLLEIFFPSLLQQKRKDEINNFFDHIIALVRSYDKSLGDKVSDVVMKLEDEYVKILDCYKDNEEVNERERILANEQELLSTLNSSMTKKK